MQIDRTLKDLHNVKSDCAILCFEAIPVMFKDTVFACCTALRQNTEADDQKQTQFCVSYAPLKKRNFPSLFQPCSARKQRTRGWGAYQDATIIIDKCLQNISE